MCNENILVDEQGYADFLQNNFGIGLAISLFSVIIGGSKNMFGGFLVLLMFLAFNE